ERIEERLFALRAAGRKYNAPVDDLAALAALYASDPALIDAGAVRLAALELTAADCAEAYAKAAATLSERRRRVAEMLDKAVSGELKPLKLERAKFSTAIESDAAAAGPHGIDRAEFWVRTNPGTQPGPLMKVASGGELARFLLALKVVIADKGAAPTLVFDEIDTGVGGAVADAIGVRLARLGRRVQALAVTHAPQVAARADHHYLITKDATAKGKRVATRVTELEPARRREEIARMLAGAEITAEARAAAERLIKAAAGGDERVSQGGRSGACPPLLLHIRHHNFPLGTAPSAPLPPLGFNHPMPKRPAKPVAVEDLTEKQAKAEYARLQTEIAAHDRRYYQDDAPTVSDAEYDALRKRYNEIETRFPDLRT